MGEEGDEIKHKLEIIESRRARRGQNECEIKQNYKGANHNKLAEK